MDSEKKMEKATLAGGCFWCLEAVYDELRGITGCGIWLQRWEC
jgi:peptide methionine sulfoxide reductase MsrA